MALTDKLQNIGDAIRSKTGKTELLTLDEMVTEIENISGGGSNVKLAPTSISFSGRNEDNLNDSLASLDTSNMTSMVEMFYECGATSIDASHFNTSNVTDMMGMFCMCANLQSLDVSGFDMGKVTQIFDFVFWDFALENLSFGYNLGKGYWAANSNHLDYTVDLSTCELLTHDSLVDVINKLYDLKLVFPDRPYTQELILGSTNLAKVTAEEIAIATNKGWAVS